MTDLEKTLLSIALKYRDGYIYGRHDQVKFTPEEADCIMRLLLPRDLPFVTDERVPRDEMWVVQDGRVVARYRHD